MKIVLISLFIFTAANAGKNDNKEHNAENVTFYRVPLECGAAPDIGCGSRAKPLFRDAHRDRKIQEAWLNRHGTVIAIVWNEPDPGARAETMDILFKAHRVNAVLVEDGKSEKKLFKSFTGKGKWYEGMEVDLLSIEEAGVIAETTVYHALKNDMINSEEAKLIKVDLNAFFKKDLVKVRTATQLYSQNTQNDWINSVTAIFEKHIGKERTPKVMKLLAEKRWSRKKAKASKKSCCETPKKSL